MFNRVPTPCIGVCSTSNGETVCRGCKRFSHEVAEWHDYTEDQRFLIAQRVDLFLTQLVKNKFEVIDFKVLFNRLKDLEVEFSERKNALCWIYTLLTQAPESVGQPEDFGFAIKAEWRGRSLVSLRDDIDRELFELSQTHYERYFAPAVNSSSELRMA